MTNNASANDAVLEVDSNKNITEGDVAAYLSQHPDFFIKHRDVLADMQVHHQNQGIVSLTQIQLEQYRERVKQQKKQLESMLINAKRNEDIYTCYADLNLAISKCQSIAELEIVLQQHLCDTLGMIEARLFLLNEGENRLPELPQKSLLEKKLFASGYFFGRIRHHEKQLLFSGEEIGSVALVRIGEDPALAVLAIASKEPLHFTPDMDTTLLQYVHDFLHFHLQRLLSS